MCARARWASILASSGAWGEPFVRSKRLNARRSRNSSWGASYFRVLAFSERRRRKTRACSRGRVPGRRARRSGARRRRPRGDPARGLGNSLERPRRPIVGCVFLSQMLKREGGFVAKSVVPAERDLMKKAKSERRVVCARVFGGPRGQRYKVNSSRQPRLAAKREAEEKSVTHTHTHAAFVVCPPRARRVWGRRGGA